MFIGMEQHPEPGSLRPHAQGEGSRGSQDPRAPAWGAVSGQGGQPAGLEREREPARGEGSSQASRGRPRPRRLGHTHRRRRAYLLLLGGQLRRHVRPGRGHRLHPAVAAAGGTGLIRERGSPNTRTLVLRPGASAALGRLAHGGTGTARRLRRLPTPLLRASETRLRFPRGGNASVFFTPFLTLALLT